MPVIGTFSAVNHGYTGIIRTLTLSGRVTIHANVHKSSERAPDFRIALGETEIGVAWRKIKHGTEQTYLRVRLDDPAWPGPIWGVLLAATADGVLRLIWNRHRPLPGRSAGRPETHDDDGA